MEITTFWFDARYHLEQMESRPSGKVWVFSRPRRCVGANELILETGSESLWLKIKPLGGETWVGGFEFGPGGLVGIFATPSPDVLCVVAKGQGFWVPVFAPEKFHIIGSIPIQSVIAVPGKEMLLFVDYTKLEAYGKNGFLWRTERLSWDGLKITEVTAERIRGTAWDSPGNREIPFSVDTESGLSQGGSSPLKYQTE